MKTLVAVFAFVTLGFLGWSQRDHLKQAVAVAEEARDAPGEIAQADTSKLVTRRIWAGPQVDPLGTPSADGRFLSHVDWSTGDLAVRDLTTGTSRRLTSKGSWFESSEFALFSNFSPDGRRILYQWFNSEFEFDLRVVDVEGGSPRVVYRNPQVEYPIASWFPDGERLLAVLSLVNRSNQIAVLSPRDGGARVLRTFDWRYPNRAQVSPDGRWIAYDFPPREDHPQRDVYVLAADGTREIQLSHPANDEVVGWMPDGRHLAMTSDRTGTMALWIVPLDQGKAAGKPQLVKSDMWRIMPMGITRTGALFYNVQSGNRDVYLATVDLTAGRVLAPPARAAERFVGSNFQADWSPDGRYLAYLSQRTPVAGPRPAALVVRAVTSGEERVFTPGMNYLQRPRWAPDGKSILVTGQDRKNRQGLYLISAQTGEVSPLIQSEPQSNATQAEWSPDGKTVYYRLNSQAEKPPRQTRIMALDRSTGASRELRAFTLPAGFGSLAISPDGAQLAYVQFEGTPGPNAFDPILQVLPTAGGAPREIARFEKTNVTVLGWTRDGRSLLYERNESPEGRDPVFAVWVQPLAGGEPRRIELVGEVSGRNLRVHPDGRRVAFTAGQDRNEIWVMEGIQPAKSTAAPAPGAR